MNRYNGIASVILCIGTACADDLREGYVLKSDEGEVTWAGTIIKASSETGTRGIEVLVWPALEGTSIGLHYHVEADEFFFIISGSGVATIGDQIYEFESGDFIFVPAGVDHRLLIKESVKVFEFLDQPNQVGELRSWHRKYGDAAAESVEQLNDIAAQFGTVYKTID